VEGATSTSGSEPGGSATSAAGGSHSSGPTVCVAGSATARGYSSAGKVATSASCDEIPPCTRASGPSPSRRRVSLSSRRPRSSPASVRRDNVLHSVRPTKVRGRRAPKENGGHPRSVRGSRWGMTVATGTPSSSPASAGARVRMSATTASGAKSATRGRVDVVALRTAS